MRSALGIAALAAAVCLVPARLAGQGAPAGGGSSPGAGPGGGAQPGARAGAAQSASACRVEGVWELVSASDNGQPRSLHGYRQRKVVAHGHFMWLGEPARRDTIQLRTRLDSLRAMQVMGGAGTYTLAGDTYIERLEYFYDPTMEGQRFPALCRTEGDRWYHTFPPPTGLQSSTNQPSQTVEVWRRIR